MSKTVFGERRNGNHQQAAVALMEGLVLNPNSPKLPADLARLYSQTARDTCALDSSRGNRINLGCPWSTVNCAMHPET